MNDFIEKMINFKDWKLYRFFEGINKTFVIVASIIVFLLTLVTVVLRYLLHISIFGLNEVIMMVIFYVYFFGAAQGSLEDSQIRADMIGTLIHNQTVVDICHSFARLIEMCVLFICVLWSVQYIINDLQVVPTSTILKIPLIATHVAFLVGFILMFVFSIAWFVRQCCITIRTIQGGTGK